MLEGQYGASWNNGVFIKLQMSYTADLLVPF